MRRPGPLQEWPLERFLPPNPNLPNATPSKSIKSNKRTLSPAGVPNLYSPAKRRILDEEGILSPERTCKSPLHTLRGRISTQSRFTDVLVGAKSPVKKLDFGLPKNHPESNNNLAVGDVNRNAPKLRSSPSPSVRSLAPSPEPRRRATSAFSASVSCTSSDGEDEDDCSPTPHSPVSRPPSEPILLPRDLPPQSDPQSMHYPGFSVFQDPYIVIFPTFSTRDDSAEVPKENVPPRRKSRKSTTPAVAEQKLQPSSIVSPKRESGKSNKAKSTPSTPKTIYKLEDITPTRNGFGIDYGLRRITRASATKLVEDERKHLRRILEGEVDNVAMDDDDDDDYGRSLQ